MRNFLRFVFPITIFALIAACGGGGGGGGSKIAVTDGSSTTPTGDNVHPIAVNGGPQGVPNLAFTSVIVCVPGTSQCQTINNIIVDTGSVGLRLVPSALSINLPAQTAANGNALFNCGQFADTSHAWGPVRRADIKLGSNTASNVPVQTIGDVGSNSEPVTCGGGDSNDNLSNVANMGGNGIIGVGYFREDCGDRCTSAPNNLRYYSCLNGSCTPSLAALNIQLQNPVALFSSDNNGVIIQLPSVSSSGEASVNGWMIFGIGTRSNNSLGSATIYTTTNNGYITTNYKNQTYPQSFIDSGSNGLFFPDASIPDCTLSEGFYCPTSTLQLSATIRGENNNTATIAFSVVNTESLNGNLNAFNNLAGHFDNAFDWGMPFFFGRKVYTAFDTGTQQPYIAF